MAVVMERDLARTLRGKISPVTTQAMGPCGVVSGVVEVEGWTSGLRSRLREKG